MSETMRDRLVRVLNESYVLGMVCDTDEDCLEQARRTVEIVLAAMREPTEAMTAAGFAYVATSREIYTDQLWQAMIAAAAEPNP